MIFRWPMLKSVFCYLVLVAGFLLTILGGCTHLIFRLVVDFRFKNYLALIWRVVGIYSLTVGDLTDPKNEII